MSLDSTRPSRWLSWTLLAGFWLIIALSFASQFYISSAKVGRPVSLGYAVSYAFQDWVVFAVMSLPVMWLARRYRLTAATWELSVPVHLGGSLAFSLLYVVFRTWVAQWQASFNGTPVGFSDTFQPLLVKVFHFSFLVYWVIVGVSHAFAFYSEARERERRALELERRLTEARLQALQMQLNPHFLFNTLHAISALMHQDVEAADRMIARLSELLRYALESTGSQEVPLRQELHFLGRYMEIEQTRFGARLNIERDIDPETLDALVPNLLLQPLVENAIRHGIEPHARPGKILLRARRNGDVLELEVRDNGAGLPEVRSKRPGVGVANTRARLQELYGERQQLDLANHREGGLAAVVRLPWRPVTTPESEETSEEPLSQTLA